MIMKLKKNQVLYSSKKIDSYSCSNCIFFIADKNRCYIHQRNEEINSQGTCNYFISGNKINFLFPSGFVNKYSSGYDEPESLVNCSNCENFIPDKNNLDSGDCNLVDKKSDGDDSGFISCSGCCNLWQDKLVQIRKNEKELKARQDRTKIVQKVVDIAPKSNNSNISVEKLLNQSTKKG